MSVTKALPDKIGSLLFCPSCGSLLDVPGDEDIIKCEPCGMTQDASSEFFLLFPPLLGTILTCIWEYSLLMSVYDNVTITTRSHPSAFPSALRRARQLVTAKNIQEDMHEEATIKEMCPNCKTEEEMTFVNVQTRGADEGTSLFYTCTKCGHKWNQ